MGRRQAAQIDLEVPEETPVEQAPEIPAPTVSRRTRVKTEERSGLRKRIRRVLIWTGAGMAVLGIIVGGYQVDQYLASNAAFILVGAPDAKQNPNFGLDGVHFAPRAEVMRVFARDFGRSVYLLPLAERRRNLMSIDWIKEATVSRHWPNRLSVRVTERRPIAFVTLPKQTSGVWSLSETALVDAEGVILRPPARATFSLPVLTGMTRQDTALVRGRRVQQAAQFIQEAQNYGKQISEIDVSDPDNLVITQMAQGRAVRLMLGNRNYFSRLNNFMSHYPDINRRLPNATTFDLRLDDHITARDGGTSAR